MDRIGESGTVMDSMARPGVPAETMSRLRVAVVQFWLSGYGGSEKVLEAIGEIFPQADFYALVVRDGAIPPSLRGRKWTTSFVDRIPGARRWYRHFLPLFPYALEQFDLSGYDLVISSESGPAKGVLTSPRACHICYCLSPMRYIWDMYHEYRKKMNPLARAAFSLTAHYARQWDVSTAARVDYFAAISDYVAARVQKYYRRESTVIYPPVDVSKGYLSDEREDYYLAISRLVPYKRLDLAIDACNRLGRRLRIVGTGPEYNRLRKLAGPTIRFLGKLDENSLRECYARCRAFLFPAEEDFGIAPVEAQSFGRPVIAYGRGGAVETVIGLADDAGAQSATGILFAEQTAESLAGAIVRFEEAESSFSPEFIRASAQRFSLERFKEEFVKFAAGRLAEFQEESGGWSQRREARDLAQVPAGGAGGDG
ncbi:MAG TPA: glycosyltransferase [Terriglobia bacterium]|nr:glycosyltransferase [Terriglobia bacterium]